MKTVQQNLSDAFAALVKLQNDEIPMHAQDSKWKQDHEDALADAMDGVRGAQALLPQESQLSPPEA